MSLALDFQATLQFFVDSIKCPWLQREKTSTLLLFFVALSDCIAMLSDNEHENLAANHRADQTANH